MKAAFSAALCVAVVLSVAAGARAQVAGPSPSPAAPSLPGAPKPGVAASAAPSADALDYDKFVKTAHKQDGLFPIYRVSGRVYMEVRDDQLDTDFLEHIVPANGLGGYGFHGGDQFTQSGRIVRFHEAGKSIVLIWPHTRFIATPGTAIATAVHESTADSVETMLPIVTADKARKVRVLDVSPLLGDLLDLGTSLTQAVGADKNPEGTYRLAPTRTYFGPSKAFPENVIVEADETFTSAGIDGVDTVPDSRFVQMRVKYNFSKILSSPDYVPRLYDERVGYWEDPHAAFDRDDERDNLRWYVLRWNMAPSDPTQRLSPAKSPIVFYLDRSIPDQYRGAVRDGILEWNKPFERIGISNAVQVLDPPNDPAWDPDDIRYSVIRWVTDEPSEFGAEAQIVWDPRTGQIFRGGVLLDSNLGRNAKFGERNLLDALTFPQADDAAPRATHGNRYAPEHDESTFGRGEAAQAAFGSTALELMGETDKLDTFVYQRIKAVTMHEVGHDFGLSHNFIAHNAFSPEELKSASFTKTHGTSSSVMDYWPVNIWPKGTSQGTYSPIALGPYDYHVIHWGYASVPGAKTPQDEKPTLDRWAAASVDPKYAFAGDEDGDFVGGHAIDPRAAPFLLSNRPMDWCSTQLDMTKGFIGTLDRRFPAPQEPWEDERVAFLSLLNRYSTCAMSLTHYIGGEYLSRNRVGDPGTHAALTPVPRA
ncbi:MAG: zinc-dependent metalloprotease, partial [Candidatus Eremiobacteraeota bacterium]|nr:zinc-dependent metalloprotease [Candidatus Eremiobacteraeota bacterium]